MNLVNNLDFRRWTIANFIVLAMFGVALRYLGCFPIGAINYLNILHAHSHFAFSGWIFMAFVILVSKYVNLNHSTVNKIQLLTLISSFGMLISFSFQGYKFTSIAFSTLFLIISYWFAYLIYIKRKSNTQNLLSRMLVNGSIIFLVVSSIGPLALGALKATGNTGIIYQNAIYFYLHFQLNGWMLLAALGLIIASFVNLNTVFQRQIKPWLTVYILSALPLFFIFTLWSKPPQWVFITAFLGALINALSWFVIIFKLRDFVAEISSMVRIAVISVSLKAFLQLLICLPEIGEWALLNRNLAIGYVHLISLGCVSPVLIWKFTHLSGMKNLGNLNVSYFVLTVFYLATLFIQPLLHVFGVAMPYFQYSLLFVSVLYCAWGICFYRRLFVVREQKSEFKIKNCKQ